MAQNPIIGGPARGGGTFGSRNSKDIVKPRSFSGTMRRLWRYLRPERKPLAIIFIFVLIDAALTLVGPYIIGVSVDRMAAGKTIELGLLEQLLLLLTITYVAEGGLAFLKSWLMAGVSQRVVKELRRTLFAKLQKLPVAFFDTHTHGELMSRLANDIDNVSSTISQSSIQLMGGIIAIIGSLIMMLVLSPALTLASLITVPLVILLTRTVSQKTSILFKDQQVQLGKLNSHVEETISGIQVIKAFNHEQQAIEDFRTVNQQLCNVGMKAQIWSGFIMPLMNVINNIGLAAIAIVGGTLAVQDVITVGVIASFVSYSRQFVRPLNELANIFNILQSGVAGAERVFEILDEQEETPDPAAASALDQPQGQVVFDHVSFGYRPDVPILKNVSFSAQPGSRVAFVGPTGAGKTTVVNLLTRFYEVQTGRILIDGRDIRDYTRESLRRCFGIVLQDTYLFAGTIKDNIKYGKPDASDPEVFAAAAKANAASFIKRLPKQYDTLLAENGGNLSQGQKQLISIARVMLTNPAILILDEATSSIDTRTEFHIQDALRKIMHNRTTFIIAHRLNTIRDADKILVIQQGEIAEQGTHEQLINQQGAYYQLYNPVI
ncbi:putative ABC transporter ATP-binding protein YfiC [Sporomusaceae bacterium FL31]|nr:putative ABC transporter ATP-binding protein YfiC [Sporomusaceae bacterium FL31]GCE32776.1 putative ABC transporter ATP-binding protein YfiC [Sporomusaceae bacterium]